jgi:hypothetical protein
VNFSDPFGLCPTWAGGDGKTNGFSDCSKEQLAKAQGGVEEAAFSPSDLFFIGGGLSRVGGKVARSAIAEMSEGMAVLFRGGSVRGKSLIEIRSILLENGFEQGLARNKQGYLFKNGIGEEIRMMRRDGGWDIRMKLRRGMDNPIDEFGNFTDKVGSHGISIRNR